MIGHINTNEVFIYLTINGRGYIEGEWRGPRAELLKLFQALIVELVSREKIDYGSLTSAYSQAIAYAGLEEDHSALTTDFVNYIRGESDDHCS